MVEGEKMENSKVFGNLNLCATSTFTWGLFLEEHETELLVPFQQDMQRHMEAKFIETEDLRRP